MSGWGTWGRVPSRVDGANDQALSDFLACPESVRLFDVVTRSLCRRFGVDFARDGEDVRSEVVAFAWRHLTEPMLWAKVSRYRDWPTGLTILCRELVKSLVESPEYLGSRGMSTTVRRQRALAMRATELRDQLGREPSATELVAYHNAQVTAFRSSAARQGALASLSDLDPVRTVELDPTLDLPSSGHEDDCPLIPLEARSLVTLVLERCEQMDPMVALAARAYLGGYLDTEPYVGSVTDVVRATRLPLDEAQALIWDVQTVARQVLVDSFGIEMDDREGSPVPA